jgi:hypothetical protein
MRKTTVSWCYDVGRLGFQLSHRQFTEHRFTTLCCVAILNISFASEAAHLMLELWKLKEYALTFTEEAS